MIGDSQSLLLLNRIKPIIDTCGKREKSISDDSQKQQRLRCAQTEKEENIRNGILKPMTDYMAFGNTIIYYTENVTFKDITKLADLFSHRTDQRQLLLDHRNGIYEINFPCPRQLFTYGDGISKLQEMLDFMSLEIFENDVHLLLSEIFEKNYMKRIMLLKSSFRQLKDIKTQYTF